MHSDSLVKASLIYHAGGGAAVRFALNPAEYVITAGATWTETPAKGKSAPKSEFTGTNARLLRMTILFIDEWAGVKTDVVLETQRLQDMTVPTEESVKDGHPASPLLRFSWGGSSASFPCHLTSVTTTFTMFDQAGVPVRASAVIELKEEIDEARLQNPTSGGPGGARAHVVSAGDTLHSIAWREYEDAALWRGLADLNGIDDPMRLHVGRRLLIPPRAQAAERS